MHHVVEGILATYSAYYVPAAVDTVLGPPHPKPRTRELDRRPVQLQDRSRPENPPDLHLINQVRFRLPLTGRRGHGCGVHAADSVWPARLMSAVN